MDHILTEYTAPWDSSVDYPIIEHKNTLTFYSTAAKNLVRNQHNASLLKHAWVLMFWGIQSTKWTQAVITHSLIPEYLANMWHKFFHLKHCVRHSFHHVEQNRDGPHLSGAFSPGRETSLNDINTELNI